MNGLVIMKTLNKYRLGNTSKYSKRKLNRKKIISSYNKNWNKIGYDVNNEKIPSISADEISVYFQSLFNEVEDTPKFNLIGYQIEIAEMIFNKMEELHVSQAELARRLGKTRSYVSKLLSKGSNFTLNTLLEIAISLNSKWEFRLK